MAAKLLNDYKYIHDPKVEYYHLILKKSKTGDIMSYTNLFVTPAEKKGYYYELKYYNLFSKNMMKLPKNVIKQKITAATKIWLNDYHCGKKVIDFEKKPTNYKKLHPKCKIAKTFTNGLPQHVVCLTDNMAYVYGENPKENYDIFLEADDYLPYTADTLLFKTPLKRYFISKGQDIEDPTKSWNGAQVLVELKNGNYLLIGNDIYEYKLEVTKNGKKVKDNITKFYAPIGGSRTPRPIAVSQTKIYSLDGISVSISNNSFNNLSDKNFMIKCTDQWEEIMYRDDEKNIGKKIKKLT